MQKPKKESKDCIQCHLGPICTHDALDVFATEDVSLNIKKYHQVKRRQMLNLSQQAFQSLYVVKSGVVKTNQIDMNGHEIIRNFYFAGEIFGFEAIYSNEYDYQPVALVDSVICEVPYDHFLEILHQKNNLELQKYILYLLSQQLNRGNYLTGATAEQRVAAFFLDISTRIHPPKRQMKFILPMTRYDIGSYLNLSAETVSRIFTNMRKAGLIDIQYKVISILQLEKLKQAASKN